MSHEGDLYDDKEVTFLHMLWGDGYLSPGGVAVTGRMIEGIDVRGKTVLDIGSGAAGITCSLATEFGAGHVIGLDVETTVCARARAFVERHGLADRVEIRQVEPGPLPILDASVDMVFSKDSILHIADKTFLAREAHRVLKPGGWFAASDWLIGHDGPPSPEFRHYLVVEALDFEMASPARYRAALEAAGFSDIAFENRNPWYRDVARAELARLEGPERPDFERMLSPEEIARQIGKWKAMLPVIDTGEHAPHLFRARKPG